MFPLALSIAVLAVALPALMVITVEDAGRSQGWVITTVIAVWSGIRLSMTWVRGTPRLFEFFFWLFTYIFMGIGATTAMRANQVPYTTSGIDPALDMPTALITLSGVVAFELGSFVTWLTTSHSHAEHSESPFGISAWRAGLLYVAGIAAGGYYIYRLGLSTLFSDRTTASMAQSQAWSDSSTFAIIYAMAIYPMLVAIGALVNAWRALPKGHIGRLLYPVVIAAGFAVLMLVANPVSSARYTFGTVAFALVLFVGAVTTRRRARWTMLGTIFAFLFLFPLLSMFRYDVSYTHRTDFFSEYQNNPDYDAFFQIANAYSYVVDGLVVPGRQLLGSLLFWVPRSLWSGKPEDTGIMLADFRGYSFTNLSAPVWAELLVNGGVIAVPIGFLLLGALVRRLDNRMASSHTRGGWLALVGSVIPAYTLILWRGSLLQATGSFVVMMAGLFWVRRRLPQSSGQPTAPL